MPELTAIHFGLLALMLVIGLILGWIFRSDRCAKEKIAVSASWQEQLDSQQSEHDRLAQQNKSLMEQISQYQASHKDHSNRAKELSASLKEALARRDELEKEAREARGNVEVALAQRDRLRRELERIAEHNPAGSLKEKDDKIFRLSRELTSWQSRVPPLVERFQERDKRARELEEELQEAQARIEELEAAVRPDQTRIEPVDAESLPDGGDASNEPIAMTAEQDVSALKDQIGDDDDLEDMVDDESVEESADDEDAEPMLDEDALVDDDEDTRARADETSFNEGVFSGADGENDTLEEPLVDDTEMTGIFARTVDDLAAMDDPSTGDGESDRDDLQQIKGIGPSIEKTLNELGIYRYHQIAEMDEVEIDRVAQQLRGFRSRVYREDWIGQARDLQYQKDNGPG